MAKTHKATKVLFISSWFPNRVTPFNGDFVERHALAVSRNCKTAVLHVAPDINVRDRFMEIFEIQKEELFEVIIYIRRITKGPEKFVRLINQMLYGLAYFIGYWIVKFEIGSPEIIHANIVIPISRVALMFHRFTRVPYIISEHWTMFITDEKKKIPSSYAKSISKAFALVPVTNNLRDAMISHGLNGKYFVVPNVVDTKIFTPDLNPITAGRKRILHVSSMKEEQKNISGIIRSLKVLRTLRADFTFTFAGDATIQQKDKVSAEGLSDCVIFTGEVDHRKVAEIMRKSDFLVMFSNFENLPCVILEALACGIPVLSTRVGGISEWLTGEYGLLTDPGNEKGLCDGMNYLLDHYNEYGKERLHDYAVKNFSPGVIASQFLSIYNEALNHKKE